MQSNNSTTAYIMVATSLPEGLARKVHSRAKAEMHSVSDHIRNVTAKWIEAGCPTIEVHMERFRVPIGAYFVQSDYNRLKDNALRRRLSLAHAVRIAMTWYHQ